MSIEAKQYSKIKSIVIRNFRNLGHVEIDCTKSGIICFKGDNEAGKTSIVKALKTALLNDSPREQKNYIRTGTNGFLVGIMFDDNTVIGREKLTDSNNYSVVYPDGHRWDISKVSEGLPVQVEEIAGLIKEPETGEYLHFRSYEDQLLFAVTSYSTNYKVMYNALKVEQLMRAIKAASTDINTYKKEINDASSTIDTIEGSKRAINIVDTTQLISIRQRIESQLSLLDKLEKAEKILNNIEEKERQLGLIRLLDKFGVSEVDIPLAMQVNASENLLVKSENLLSKQSIISDIQTLQEVDTTIADKLIHAIQINNKVEESIKELSKIKDAEQLESISETIIYHINNSLRTINTLDKLENDLKVLNVEDIEEVEQSSIDSVLKLRSLIDTVESNKAKQTEYEDCLNKVAEGTQKLKELGVAFETCQNCGSDVIIDIDKLKEGS